MRIRTGQGLDVRGEVPARSGRSHWLGRRAAGRRRRHKLVQALARRATWNQLRKNAVTRVVEKVFVRLGFRITQRKLGQAVSIVGTAFGAGMNASLLTKVADEAVSAIM